jgi:beta-glucosidase
MDCGEGYDRDELNLAGQQEALVRAVQATGTPLVVVLIQGRAHSIEWLAENVPAILCAWYPGQNGGTAIAETLFGDSNPAGRLPVSIPRTAANLPVYYNKKKMALRGYVFNDGSPRYPFGFGLSYSTFAYGELRLSAAAIRSGSSCVVSVEVTNTGILDGDEVVQLYICDIFCSRTRPEKELKAFRRVRIAAGATQIVSFEINEALLAYHTADMSYTTEPGTFRIMVGPDSQRTQEAQIELM